MQFIDSLVGDSRRAADLSVRAERLVAQVEDAEKRLEAANRAREHAEKQLAECEVKLQEQQVKCAKDAADLGKALRDLELREKAVAELEGMNRDLERTVRDLKVEAVRLQGQVLTVERQGATQGATYKMVVKKLVQTVGFGNWILEITNGAIEWGKNVVLRQLMKSCPRLLLKKSELGWDPHSEDRMNLLQQKAQKELPDFPCWMNWSEGAKPGLLMM